MKSKDWAILVVFNVKESKREFWGQNSRTRLLNYFKWLNQIVVVFMHVYPYAKISIIAQFSLDILQIQYWELLLICPGVPEPTRMNRLNQNKCIHKCLTTCKYSTSFLSSFLRWTWQFGITLGMPRSAWPQPVTMTV